MKSIFFKYSYREEDSESEKDKKIWYYSTKIQLAELIECLDKDYWEADLCKTLDEMREEIHRHMDVTEDLTNKARGNNKSFLSAANGRNILCNGNRCCTLNQIQFIVIRSRIYVMLFVLHGSVGSLLFHADNMLYIVDEILDIIRARKGEIAEDKNTGDEEAEKAKSDVDNDQTDAERDKEESGDQDKIEETHNEQDVEKEKTEGKETLTVL